MTTEQDHTGHNVGVAAVAAAVADSDGVVADFARIDGVECDVAEPVDTAIGLLVDAAGNDRPYL